MPSQVRLTKIPAPCGTLSFVTATAAGTADAVRRPANGRAALAILVSSGLFSSMPLLIHKTAPDNNPFYFNFVYILVHSLFLVGLLMLARNFLLRDALPDGAPRLNDPRLWGTHFITRKPTEKGKNPSVEIQAFDSSNPVCWIRAPLVWIFISSFEFAFFAWATNFTETAIVSTIYELWPAIVVYWLIRLGRRDHLYRNPDSKPAATDSKASREQIMLTALAGVGLVFMLGSQTGGTLSSPLDLFAYRNTLGIGLSVIAAVLSALSVIGSLYLAEVVFYRVLDEQTGGSRGKPNPADRGELEMRLLFGLTLLGMVISRIMVLPVSLGVGLLLSDGTGGIDGRAIVGAVLLGAAQFGGTVLLRVGNIASNSPAVNAMFFLTPLLALSWLMLEGISVDRFDLFLIGAALIIAINILIQFEPDKERNPAKFGKPDRSGTRIGFTAFILSIWTFGTTVYLRDEVVPASWLVWASSEYWGLVAVSATVFALILGFRVARVTTRIAHEDEAMLALFRDCENLVRAGMIDRSILDTLARLDTAKPKELLVLYNEARQRIRYRLAPDSLSDPLLISVEKQLDAVAHSKQLGRDIVELLSLVAFAAVTVGIGLFARADVADGGSWTGFISEVFVLVFVATIAFLCANLFDIRRERETPLLVSTRERSGNHGLFFRDRQNRTFRHVVATLISLIMTTVFCILLYHKWI